MLDKSNYPQTVITDDESSSTYREEWLDSGNVPIEYNGVMYSNDLVEVTSWVFINSAQPHTGKIRSNPVQYTIGHAVEYVKEYVQSVRPHRPDGWKWFDINSIRKYHTQLVLVQATDDLKRNILDVIDYKFLDPNARIETTIDIHVHRHNKYVTAGAPATITARDEYHGCTMYPDKLIGTLKIEFSELSHTNEIHHEVMETLINKLNEIDKQNEESQKFRMDAISQFDVDLDRMFGITI